MRSRFRDVFERVLIGGTRPRAAGLGGVLFVVALGAVLSQLDDEFARAPHALTRVVPVVVTAVVGGRKAAYVVAGTATVVFSLPAPTGRIVSHPIGG